jgi:hypothetical protein
MNSTVLVLAWSMFFWGAIAFIGLRVYKKRSVTSRPTPTSIPTPVVVNSYDYHSLTMAQLNSQIVHLQERIASLRASKNVKTDQIKARERDIEVEQSFANTSFIVGLLLGDARLRRNRIQSHRVYIQSIRIEVAHLDLQIKELETNIQAIRTEKLGRPHP